MLENWHLYAEITDTTVDMCGFGDYAPLTTVLGLVAAVTVGALDALLPGLSASGRALATITAITGAAAGDPLTSAILNEWLGYYGLGSVATAAGYAGGIELAAAWPQPAVQIESEVAANLTPSGVGAAGCELRYKTCAPTMDTINIEAHGVPLYRDVPSAFFNSYVPYNYGGQHIRTPDDCGVHMIPFNLYPGSYQPSGHVNISRAREFYLAYTSSNVGVTVTNADLVVC